MPCPPGAAVKANSRGTIVWALGPLSKGCSKLTNVFPRDQGCGGMGPQDPSSLCPCLLALCLTDSLSPCISCPLLLSLTAFLPLISGLAAPARPRPQLPAPTRSAGSSPASHHVRLSRATSRCVLLDDAVLSLPLSVPSAACDSRPGSARDRSQAPPRRPPASRTPDSIRLSISRTLPPGLFPT